MTTIRSRAEKVFEALAENNETELSLFQTRYMINKIMEFDVPKSKLRYLLWKHCDWNETFVDIPSVKKIILVLHKAGSVEKAMERPRESPVSTSRSAPEKAADSLSYSEFDLNIRETPIVSVSSDDTRSDSGSDVSDASDASNQRALSKYAFLRRTPRSLV
jgi:hypothetical protein